VSSPHSAAEKAVFMPLRENLESRLKLNDDAGKMAQKEGGLNSEKEFLETRETLQT
jgi:hypothetical protein